MDVPVHLRDRNAMPHIIGIDKTSIFNRMCTMIANCNVILVVMLITTIAIVTTSSASPSSSPSAP
eukprot:4981551-Pyramimonas_sp.AAC.1